jgi:hypothetical protein
MNVLEDLEVEDEMALGSGVVQMVAEVIFVQPVAK